MDFLFIFILGLEWSLTAPSPCNVSKMRDIHRGSPRTTVYPLLVHEDGVQYEHVLHLAAGDPLDPSAPPVPGNFYNPRTESTFKYSGGLIYGTKFCLRS